MARIRSIKPEFWHDERLASVSRDARLLFIGMWNLADDFGVLRANPRLLKGQVFPYDEIDVSPLLGELERAARIVRYRPDGEDLVLVRNFTKHQKLDRRTKHRPELPAGFRIAEVDGEDAEGKPGRVLRVLEDSPPIPPDKSAGSADSPRQVGGDGRAPPNPAAGRDGTGRDGSGTAAGAANNITPPFADATTAHPNPPVGQISKGVETEPGSSDLSRALEWGARAHEAYEAMFPTAVRVPPEAGVLRAFWMAARKVLEGKRRPLRDLDVAWAGFLASEFWRDCDQPCPWDGWVKHWSEFLPGQSAPATAGHGGRVLRPVLETA